MRPGDCRLGEQGTTRSFLGMRVRDVEPHAARAARPDFYVGLCAGAAQPFGDDLRMTNELWHRELEQMLFHRSLVRRAVLRMIEQLARALKNVLIRERGRSIDAVHDRVGRVSEQELKQEIALQDLLCEITEQVA